MNKTDKTARGSFGIRNWQISSRYETPAFDSKASKLTDIHGFT